MIEVSLRRRHLNEFQLGELGYQLKAIERKLGKQLEKATAFTSETAKVAREKREKKKQALPSAGGKPFRTKGTQGNISIVVVFW